MLRENYCKRKESVTALDVVLCLINNSPRPLLPTGDKEAWRKTIQ